MFILSRRDADIRMRGDDISIKSYLNRRYPTLRVADLYHQTDYAMRLILTPGAEEESNHIVRHHEMF